MTELINFWLLKTEPHEYSWDNLKQDIITQWTGVRNFEARNNMKKMFLGDLCFFYHTGKEKRIMGLTKVVKSYYDDPNEPKFGIIDIEYFQSCNKSLSLNEIKLNKSLHNILLLKRSRLSVMPITNFEAKCILNLTDTYINF